MGGLIMKAFNLEEAKAGKAVCTRDGRKVRILCFDLKDDTYPIGAAVEFEEGVEELCTYTLDGSHSLVAETDTDLMMVSEKYKGWMNIFSHKGGIGRFIKATIYPSEEAAKEDGKLTPNTYITTIKIEWEE